LFHSKAGADNKEKIADRLRAIEAARQNKELYVRTMITNIFGEARRDKCAEAIETMVVNARGLSFETIEAAQQVMISRPDNIDALKKRNFPLYYFLGDLDTSLPIEIMRNEISQLPGAVAHIASGIGHMGHIECTSEAVEFIQRILRADAD
jgi:pimeloyl-ACP methyl ester carboxylesterase